ncbi:MAG: hypothetical protein AAGH15_27865 [Myxococcota bacterium]
MRFLTLAALGLACASLAPPGARRSRAQAGLPCRHEDPLALMAATLSGRARLEAGEIQQALRAAGSDLPGARVLRGSPAQLERTLRALARSEDAELVCGLAREGGTGTLVVAARGGALEPVALPSEETGLRVVLAADFGDAYVAFRGPEGRVLRVPAAHGSTLRWPEALARPRAAQLVATGPQGPRPVALREERGARETELRLVGGSVLTQVGALRDLAGAAPLRDNRLLREAAAEHGARVCAEGRARHALALGDDPRRRLRRAHVEARVVRLW